MDYGGGSADKKGPLPAVQSKKQTAPGMIRRPNEKPGQKVTEAEGNQRLLSGSQLCSQNVISTALGRPLRSSPMAFCVRLAALLLAADAAQRE